MFNWRIIGDSLDKVAQKFTQILNEYSLKTPGARREIERIKNELYEKNRQDRLAGLDRYGKPLVPVTYRPSGRKHPVGAVAPLPNNNLLNKQYKSLVGPPLIPRGETIAGGSRAIKNFRAEFEVLGGSVRFTPTWVNYLTPLGFSLIPLHAGHPIAKRDIGGFTPKTAAWVAQEIKQALDRRAAEAGK